MRLKECLSELTKEELQEIARKNYFSGYSQLTKDELIDFLVKELLDEEFLEELINYESPASGRYFLMTLVNLSGSSPKVPTKALKEEFCKVYSEGTFYNNLSFFSERGIVYRSYDFDSEEDVVIIPNEILKKIRKIMGIEKNTKKAVNPKEGGEMPSLLDIILSNVPKYVLQDLCDELGIKKSGTKEEIAKRLIEESGLPIESLLSRLFTKEELKEIASSLGIEVKDLLKDDLISEILNKVQGIKKSPTASKRERSLEKLVEDLCKSLEKISFPRPPKNEKGLEDIIFGYLSHFRERGIRVIPQALGVNKGRSQQPDILVEEKIAVELKYLRSQRDFYTAIGQAIYYATSYPYVILYFYDPREVSSRILEDVKRILGSLQGATIRIVVKR